MMLRRQKISIRNWLRKLHLWMGLALFIPFIMLGITGSILVFEHEIENALTSEAEISETHSETLPSFSKIIAVASSSISDGFVPAQISMQGDGKVSVRFSPVEKKSQRARGPRVIVDVSTMSVVDDKPTSSSKFFRFILQLHSSLLMREQGGRNVIGTFGVIMMVMGLTGLVLWWPRNGKVKQAFTIKYKSKGLRFHRSLHAVFGIYSLIVMLVISFSGVYLAFPETTGEVVRSVFPARDLRKDTSKMEVSYINNVKPIGIDKVIELAGNDIDGKTRFISASLPANKEKPYRINFALEDSSHGAPSINVFVDQYRKKVIEVFDPRNYSAGETILAWQHAIHGGNGLGWFWKIISFVFGIIIPLFAVTGIYMWQIKRKNKNHKKTLKPIRQKTRRSYGI